MERTIQRLIWDHNQRDQEIVRQAKSLILKLALLVLGYYIITYIFSKKQCLVKIIHLTDVCESHA